MNKLIYVFESGSIVYDGSTLTEEQKSRAVVVTELPTPEKREGFTPILRPNKQTETVYFEYVEDTESEKLRQENERLQQLLNDAISLLEETEVL